jgi:hypothetical protein
LAALGLLRSAAPAAAQKPSPPPRADLAGGGAPRRPRPANPRAALRPHIVGPRSITSSTSSDRSGGGAGGHGLGSRCPRRPWRRTRRSRPRACNRWRTRRICGDAAAFHISWPRGQGPEFPLSVGTLAPPRHHTRLESLACGVSLELVASREIARRSTGLVSNPKSQVVHGLRDPAVW